MTGRDITLHFLKPQYRSAVPRESGHESADVPSIAPAISNSAKVLPARPRAQGSNGHVQCRGQLAVFIWPAATERCHEVPGEGQWKRFEAWGL